MKERRRSGGDTRSRPASADGRSVSDPIGTEEEAPIVQAQETLSLPDQFVILRTADDYVTNHVLRREGTSDVWRKGYALQSDVHVAKGESAVAHADVTIFFEDRSTGERVLEYGVRLMRIDKDDWHVLLVKEVMPANEALRSRERDES